MDFYREYPVGERGKREVYLNTSRSSTFEYQEISRQVSVPAPVIVLEYNQVFGVLEEVTIVKW